MTIQDLDATNNNFTTENIDHDSEINHEEYYDNKHVTCSIYKHINEFTHTKDFVFLINR